MKWHATTFVLLLLVFIIVPSGSSLGFEPYNYPSYINLKLGAYSPQSSDLSGAGSSPYAEFAVGIRFNKNFAAELAAGYFKVDDVQFSGIRFSGDFTSGTADITVLPLTLDLKAIYPMSSIELYGEAGFGVYISQGELKSTTASVVIFETLTEFPVGYYLGAGGDMTISDQTYAGLNVRYLVTEPDFDISKFDLSGITATIVLGYRF